jgi:hypothetical protein
LGRQDRQALKDRLGHRECKDSRECKVRSVRVATLACKVQLDLKDRRVTKVIKVIKGIKGCKVRSVHKDRQA